MSTFSHYECGWCILCVLLDQDGESALQVWGRRRGYRFGSASVPGGESEGESGSDDAKAALSAFLEALLADVL